MQHNVTGTSCLAGEGQIDGRHKKSAAVALVLKYLQRERDAELSYPSANHAATKSHD